MDERIPLLLFHMCRQRGRRLLIGTSAGASPRFKDGSLKQPRGDNSQDASVLLKESDRGGTLMSAEHAYLQPQTSC